MQNGRLRHQALRPRTTSGSCHPSASVNFVTAHDDFTLLDLVTHNQKHNEANGEENRNETTDNESWNCGFEGPTTDATIPNVSVMVLVTTLIEILILLPAARLIGRRQVGTLSESKAIDRD